MLDSLSACDTFTGASLRIILAMSELEFLEHYNKKILKYGDNQEVLLKSLGKLDQVRVTIDLLAVGYRLYTMYQVMHSFEIM